MTLRQVQFNTPRGWAHCEQCSERLDYQYASIRWRCRSRDLCPKCEGTMIGREIAEQFGRDLNARTGQQSEAHSPQSKTEAKSQTTTPADGEDKNA